MDPWNRYTCEGYGHLQMGMHPLGSAVHFIRTWAPLGGGGEGHTAGSHA